jgi:hypothetical protein
VTTVKRERVTIKEFIEGDVYTIDIFYDRNRYRNEEPHGKSKKYQKDKYFEAIEPKTVSNSFGRCIGNNSVLGLRLVSKGWQAGAIHYECSCH